MRQQVPMMPSGISHDESSQSAVKKAPNSAAVLQANQVEDAALMAGA
jgi:hypothetical protein